MPFVSLERIVESLSIFSTKRQQRQMTFCRASDTPLATGTFVIDSFHTSCRES